MHLVVVVTVERVRLLVVLSLSDAARAPASAAAAMFMVALVMSVVKDRRELVSLRLAWPTAGAREKWLASSKVTC